MPLGQTVLPLYLSLYEDIKSRIASGKLAAGDRLPSIRAAARDLKISINTVSNAYHQLEVEGYVRSPRGGSSPTAISGSCWGSPSPGHSCVGR